MRLLRKLGRKNLAGSHGSQEEDSTHSEGTYVTDEEEQRLGLVLLYAPPPGFSEAGQSGIDVVAIHGLGGDLRGTWTHKNGTLWLRDLLPQSIPGARVYTYGYPSKVFLNRSVAGIREFSIHLLVSLSSMMQDSASASRPIIYVCHSLGGVVFKQAMNLAYERYPEIWMRSKGVVFLGTPHRGSATAAPAKVFGDIFNVAWHASGGALFRRGVKTDLLRSLGQNSSELMAIADDFRQRASSLSIATFYEQFITEPLGSLVVDQFSAVVGVTHERPCPLWADHREICRFESAQSDNYKHVLASIQRITEEALKEMKDTASSTGTSVSLDDAERACAAILNCVDVSGYESNLDQRADGTLQWISSDPQYESWLSKHNTPLLWVTGFSGCGKTILSSYVVGHLSEMLPSSAVICRFFCNGRIDSQRDIVYLLRSIIHQVIMRRPKLLRIVRRASDTQGFQLFNRFDALWNLFLDICRHERAGSIFVIIDAIDECEDQTQVSITERIVRLLESTIESRIKFFVTSRPNVPATYVLKQAPIQYIRLNLEEKQGAINEDIKLVIRQRLNALVQRERCDPETADRLQKLLVEKADRTFLWVSMVLSLLEMRRYLTPLDLDGLVQRIPSDLKTLYEHFLGSMPAEDMELAGRLLRIIVAAARPLREKEIQTILAADERWASETSSQMEIAGPKLESIQVLLGPLVRILDSKIHLVHQSLKEYLIELGADKSHPLAQVFGVNFQQDQLTIARACMDYLSRTEFQRNLFENDCLTTEESPKSITLSPEVDEQFMEISLFAIQGDSIFRDQTVADVERCTAIATQYGFFDYAATYWAAHLFVCESFPLLQLYPRVVTICNSRSDACLNWLRYFWISQDLSESLPADMDELAIWSFFGLSGLVRMFLETTELQNPKLGNAIYWASRNGHAACVEEILNRNPHLGADIGVNSLSPLAVAAQCGSSQCVRVLVSSGYFDLDDGGPGGRTPLSLAAGGGHDEAVRTLLEYDLDVNRPDHSGSSPLFWAVAGNAADTVSILLADKRTNSNHLDRKHRNALSWAAAEGYDTPLSRLLRDPQIDANVQDVLGQTPLILATIGGHFDNVELLLRSSRVDAATTDFNGRNAISWAAEQQDFKILHLLLKHDGPGADTQDRDGWTPLAWALNPPGYPQNIDTLVQSGYIDINRKDHDGRTPLSFAAGYGYLKVTQILCGTRGVDIDCRDNLGRTPLSYAAGAGNFDIVKFLISTKNVDINSKDTEGCTPLSKAAMRGSSDIVKFLAEIPDIEMDSMDERGRTPLWFAEHYGREDVVSFLKTRSQ